MASPATWSYYVAADGPLVISVRGEIDLASAGRLRHHLEQQITATRPARLVVDLGQVTFIDSLGIHALLAVRSHADQHGVQLRLRGLTPFIERQLHTLGLYAHLVHEG